MTAREFLIRHNQSPCQIDGAQCLEKLGESASDGLRGRGGLPMIPAYLSGSAQIPEDGVCAVMDAGGTNLRTAQARFQNRKCTIENVKTIPMPASSGEVLSKDQLYGRIASELSRLENVRSVGCCFSYLVDIERSLDGRLRGWCKEIRCPDAVGQFVGKSITEALPGCEAVAVLNDTTAALLGAKARLGAHESNLVGLVMGTGVNVCYTEDRQKIGKLESDISCPDMIINTEVGEFDGIPLGAFEREVIQHTDDPSAAQAEKQCSGAYLADIIAAALGGAVAEGCIARAPHMLHLGQVSDFLENPAGEIAESFDEGDIPFVRELMDLAVDRAAKIGAILCAEFVRRSAKDAGAAVIVAEGSLFWKMYRFPERFSRELSKLIPGISFRIERAEGACLEGAAMAAFAHAM